MKKKNDELLDLVDENDNVIGTIWKSEVHGDPTKIHREMALVIFNDKGETLLQQRSFSKHYDPGMWQLSVSGHIAAGEGPLEATKREAFEETGLAVEPVFVGKEFIAETEQSRYFWLYYSLVSGRPELTFDKSEIESFEWIRPKDISQWEKENDFKVDPKSKSLARKVIKKLQKDKLMY